MVQPDKDWYYVGQDGNRQGPVDHAALHALYANGSIKLSSLVWVNGIENWQSFDTVFNNSVGSIPPPIPDSTLPPPLPIQPAGNGMTKQLSSSVFILLIFVSTFVVGMIFSENGIGTILLSLLIAATFVPTVVGFSLAKLITKNERRTWIEIIWFQVLNFVGGFISLAAAGPNKILVALAFAFLASTLLFWLQNKSRSDSK